MKLFTCCLFLILITSCELLGGPIVDPDNEKPRVEITSPEDGATFARGETVTLNVSASDADGSVNEVVFYTGGEARSTQTEAPYRYTFTAQELGDDTLVAVAYDDKGESERDTVSIRVGVEEVPDPDISVSISPTTVTLAAGEATTFTATLSNSSAGLIWTKTAGTLEVNGTEASYTAPGTKGSYEVTATSVEDPTQSDTATVTVTNSSITEPFTIVALPDTQGYTCVGDDGNGCGSEGMVFKDTFVGQTQWIVDNLDTENIAFVTHEGDMVDVATRDIEWRNAEEAMSLLDGKVPYSVAMGDHDYGPEEHRDGDTRNFRKYYGSGRYSGYSWYGGASPDNLSHYQLVPMGGVQFLHIALEWEAPSAALNWAKGVITANLGVPTIITTHAYLIDGDSPGLSNFTESCINLPSNEKCPDPGNDPDASSGEDIFEALVEPYEQVFMVLNGHFHFSGRRSSCEGTNYDCDNGEFKLVSLNSAGTKVYQMLANYQSYDNGGDGWLRIIRFLPGGGEDGLDRIQVKTYSPKLDEFQAGNASDFSFDLDFEARFGLD